MYCVRTLCADIISEKSDKKRRNGGQIAPANILSTSPFVIQSFLMPILFHFEVKQKEFKQHNSNNKLVLIKYCHSSHANFFFYIFVQMKKKSKNPAV